MNSLNSTLAHRFYIITDDRKITSASLPLSEPEVSTNSLDFGIVSEKAAECITLYAYSCNMHHQNMKKSQCVNN